MITHTLAERVGTKVTRRKMIFLDDHKKAVADLIDALQSIASWNENREMSPQQIAADALNRYHT